MVMAALAILYGLYAGTLYLFQGQMLYPTQYISAPEVARLPDEHSELIPVRIAAGEVETWLLKPLNGATRYPVLIHTHGNGDVIDALPSLFRWPRDRGWGVLLVEYPGYGRSAGQPGEALIREVVQKAYDQLAAREDVLREQIVGYGWSLGGGAICTLVGERPLAGLILRSSFTGLAEFAHRHAVPAFLLHDRYDNLAAVRRYRGPVAIFHGEQDSTIPYRMGQALAEAAGVELHTWPCGHNACPGDEDIFWSAVQPLLDRVTQATESR